MRKHLILFTAIVISFYNAVAASPEPNVGAPLHLQKEVMELFEKNKFKFPDIESQSVTVNFLINAKSELVILDVDGNSAVACDYVKEVLAFKKVKFAQLRQLTSYSITIHLEQPNSRP